MNKTNEKISTFIKRHDAITKVLNRFIEAINESHEFGDKAIETMENMLEEYNLKKNKSK